MIEQISGLPANVLGFTATGMVTAEDYETVIIPAVEERFTRQKKVRLLYHIGEEAEGFEPGAMWDDTKLGMKHITGWERIAIVTDIEWVRLAIRVFAFGMPCEVRVFGNAEMARAVHWIGEA